MESLMDYIKPELLILLPVLYFIGGAMKRSEGVKDKHIPLLLGGIGMLLAAVWAFAQSAMQGYRDILSALFMAATQGILAAGMSVYINQIIKQRKKNE